MPLSGLTRLHTLLGCSLSRRRTKPRAMPPLPRYFNCRQYGHIFNTSPGASLERIEARADWRRRRAPFRLPALSLFHASAASAIAGHTAHAALNFLSLLIEEERAA